MKASLRVDNLRRAMISDGTGSSIGRIDADGTVIPLEVDIQAIPPQHLASAYIVQPDALADNQIVLDEYLIQVKGGDYEILSQVKGESVIK